MQAVRSILMPSTVGLASDAACAVTTQLALTFGSRVTPLHVMDTELKNDAVEQYRSLIDLQLMSPLVRKMRNDSVNVSFSVIVKGGVVDQILRNADELNVDLIVLGAGERQRDGTFFPGPIAESVIQQTRRPVLAVMPGQPAAKFRRMLCPIDGSRTSLQGLQNAVRLARAVQAELRVLTVVPKVNWVTGSSEGDAARNVQEHYAALWKKDFDAVLDTVDFEGVTWSELVRHGWPGPEILATAAEYQHDLIVIGATGRTGVTRVLLGTTTRQVVQKLQCSLLVIHDQTRN
jgi:universal stress protein E